MIEDNNSEWFPCFYNNGSSISTAIQEISAKQDGIEKSFIKLEGKIEKLKEELSSNLESKFDSKLELQFSKIKDLLSK